MDFVALPLGLDLDSNPLNNDDDQVKSDQITSSVPKSTTWTSTRQKKPSRTDSQVKKKTVDFNDSDEYKEEGEEDGESNYMKVDELLVSAPKSKKNTTKNRAERSRTPSSSSRSRSKHDYSTKKTSIRLFREFIRRGSDGHLDASRIHSRECYEAWLASRKGPSNEPEKSFQRALSSHLTAVDGRVPFNSEEEAAILQVLRRKERWPCFAHCAIRFGHTGFRALGYHEKRQLEGAGDASDLAALRRERKKQLKSLDEDDDAAASPAPAARNKKRSKVVSTESDNTSYDDYEEEGNNSSSIAQAIMNGMIDDESSRVTVQNAGRYSSSSSSFGITAASTNHQQPRMDFQQTNPGDMFIGMAQNLFGGLSSVSIDAWKKLLTFGRMLLMRTGWFKRPTMEDAQRLMQAIAERHPYDGILLMDFLCPDYADRFILQNDISRRYIGAVGRTEGGFTGKLFPTEDIWKLLHATIAAFRGRGVREIPVHIGIICLGNVVVQFDGLIYVDPPTGLFAFRGRPAPLPPSSSTE